jgi:ADP-ribose pyrophosphatase
VLAVDNSRSKRDPYIVIERQYRQAAGEFLYEVPAGKMEAGEDRLAAAKRELLEETGYTARKWKELVRYFASPGFLAEWMQVFVAEDLELGQSAPEDDESFELLRVPLSELLRLIDKGQVRDGKTIIAVLHYARTLRRRK